MDLNDSENNTLFRNDLIPMAQVRQAPVAIANVTVVLKPPHHDSRVTINLLSKTHDV